LAYDDLVPVLFDGHVSGERVVGDYLVCLDPLALGVLGGGLDQV